MTLLDMRSGERARVVAIASEVRSRLDRLSTLGITPGAWLTLRQRQPAVVVDLGELELALDHSIAALIRVERGA